MDDKAVLDLQDDERQYSTFAQGDNPDPIADGQVEERGRRGRAEVAEDPGSDIGRADLLAGYDVTGAPHGRVEQRQKQSTSPPVHASMNCSLSSRCRAGSTGNRLVADSACRVMRARLASCRQAPGRRPTIVATSSKGYWNTSWSTNEVLSAGLRRSSTACMAKVTLSTRVTSVAGSGAARGYLTKDVGAEELQRALAQLAQGQPANDPAVQHHLLDAINVDHHLRRPSPSQSYPTVSRSARPRC